MDEGLFYEITTIYFEEKAIPRVINHSNFTEIITAAFRKNRFEESVIVVPGTLKFTRFKRVDDSACEAGRAPK